MTSISGGRSPLLLLAGTAFLLLAGLLPDAGVEVQAGVGTLAVALCVLGTLGGRAAPVAIAVLGVGAALLAVALAGRGVEAPATPVEALFGAAAGLLFAYGFAAPVAVVALPLLVAGIDAAAVFSGPQAASGPAGADVLALSLPAWGDDALPALGLVDATFLALFAAWSLQFGLRPRAGVALMVLGLAAVVVLSVVLERSLPTLPFLAAGLLLPALDRLPALLRAEG